MFAWQSTCQCMPDNTKPPIVTSNGLAWWTMITILAHLSNSVWTVKKIGGRLTGASKPDRSRLTADNYSPKYFLLFSWNTKENMQYCQATSCGYIDWAPGRSTTWKKSRSMRVAFYPSLCVFVLIATAQGAVKAIRTNILPYTLHTFSILRAILVSNGGQVIFCRYLQKFSAIHFKQNAQTWHKTKTSIALYKSFICLTNNTVYNHEIVQFLTNFDIILST